MKIPFSDPETPAAKLLKSTHHRRSRTIYSDRFIPSRSDSNFALFNLKEPSPESSNSAYSTILKSALLGPECVGFEPFTHDKSHSRGGFGSPSGITSPNCNIFKYKTETRRSMYSRALFMSDDQFPGVSRSAIKAPRKISRSPYKVLDAPSLQDDYFLNLVDWSALNVLAVGLGNCVYLWNASSSNVVQLCELEDDSVCSVGWSKSGTQIAVGTDSGELQLWDASQCKRIRTMEGHGQRVSSLAWSSTLLSSGSRDRSILQHDVRTQEDYVSKLIGHKSEGIEAVDLLTWLFEVMCLFGLCGLEDYVFWA